VPRTVEIPMCFTENWIWLCARSIAHCMCELLPDGGAQRRVVRQDVSQY
jgi:hypothetical protein